MVRCESKVFNPPEPEPEVFVNGIRLTVTNDYAYSATGGTGGVSQLDFTAYGGLIDGDQLTVKYYYFAA